MQVRKQGSPLADNMIIYAENSEESTKMLLELVSELSKQDTKSIDKNLYINKNHLEIEIKKKNICSN